MVTIIDVAKYAGVSKTTVSAVLNNGPHVKEETRLKVEEAVKALGYVCNNNARGLRKRETKCLGIISAIENKKIQTYEFNYSTGLFTYGVTNGILDGLDGTDYGVITERYCPAEAKGELPQLVRNARVDGVFLVGTLFTQDIVRKILECNIPAVGVNCYFDSIDCVFNDVVQGAYLQAVELLKSGCRKIALVNCSRAYGSSQDRLQGWKKAMDESSDESLMTWHTYSPKNTGEGGYLAMKQLWEDGIRPDGIAAASESVALGVMRYLSEQGVQVPRDVSLIAYSASALGGYAIPPLTSVNIHKEQMGAVAAKMLLHRIAHPDAEIEKQMIQPDLLIRESIRKK